MKGSLQLSSVLPTRAFSESNSNVHISFCTPHNIFIWVLVRDESCKCTLATEAVCPSGEVKITVSQCNRLYLILVLLHRRRARTRKLIDFLEKGLICLVVSSPSMETQDAHEHILVVGKVCHCLAILDMGVLTKRNYSVCSKYVPSMNWFVP
jgi:hypothetical protein